MYLIEHSNDRSMFNDECHVSAGRYWTTRHNVHQNGQKQGADLLSMPTVTLIHTSNRISLTWHTLLLPRRHWLRTKWWWGRRRQHGRSLITCKHHRRRVSSQSCGMPMSCFNVMHNANHIEIRIQNHATTSGDHCYYYYILLFWTGGYKYSIRSAPPRNSYCFPRQLPGWVVAVYFYPARRACCLKVSIWAPFFLRIWILVTTVLLSGRLHTQLIKVDPFKPAVTTNCNN